MKPDKDLNNFKWLDEHIEKKGDVFVTQQSSVIVKAGPDANFSKPWLISHNEISPFQHNF